MHYLYYIWLEKCCFGHSYIQQTSKEFLLCEGSIFSTENTELDKAWSLFSGESLHAVELIRQPRYTHVHYSSMKNTWISAEPSAKILDKCQKLCMCIWLMRIPCQLVGNSCTPALASFLKSLWLFCWSRLWVRQVRVGRASGEHLLDILWAHLLSMIVIMISVLLPNEGRLLNILY